MRFEAAVGFLQVDFKPAIQPERQIAQAILIAVQLVRRLGLLADELCGFPEIHLRRRSQ